MSAVSSTGGVATGVEEAGTAVVADITQLQIGNDTNIVENSWP